MRSGQMNIFQCLYAAAVVALLQMPMVLSGCGGSSHGGPSKDAAAGVGGSDAAGADRAVPDAAADSPVDGSAGSGGGDVASDVDGSRDAVNGDTARADSGGGDAAIVSPDAATPDAATPVRTLQILAGSVGGPGYADGAGAEARFSALQRVATDGQGNLFVEDGSTIRKLELGTGRVTTIAGSPAESGNADGTGGAARFSFAEGLVVDHGALYIGDGSNLVRRVDLATGAVTTLAGSAGCTTPQDGTGAGACFGFTAALTGNGQGMLFLTDAAGIRKVTTAGVVTTLAVTTARPLRTLGMGPGSTLFASDGNLVMAVDTTTGAVTPIAGGFVGIADGVGAAAGFFSVNGLAYDGTGVLYVADDSSLRSIVLSSGMVTTLAGSPGTIGTAGGFGAAVRFTNLTGVAWVASGGPTGLYLTDLTRIRLLNPALGSVTSIAGTAPTTGSTDGAGSAALFKNPSGLSSDGASSVYLADAGNQTLRKIDLTNGMVSTIAGTAGMSGSDDGVGAAARFDFRVAGGYPVSGPAWDGAGNLFVTDAFNNTIRKVALSTRLVSLFAGAVRTSGAVDGPATTARFAFPTSALVKDGFLYVTDGRGTKVRKIDLTTGNVVTWATAGSVAAGTDRLPGLAADDSGNLYMSDRAGHVIQRISLATAALTTLAGALGAPGSSDGVGTAAHFRVPTGLAFDGHGHLLVADSGNSTVRQIDLTSGQVTTLVGIAGQAKVQPGPLPGGLNRPEGLAVLPNGDITISDFNENAVLLVH